MPLQEIRKDISARIVQTIGDAKPCGRFHLAEPAVLDIRHWEVNGFPYCAATDFSVRHPSEISEPVTGKRWLLDRAPPQPASNLRLMPQLYGPLQDGQTAAEEADCLSIHVRLTT